MPSATFLVKDATRDSPGRQALRIRSGELNYLSRCRRLPVAAAWWQWLIGGGDAGGVYPVRLADGRSGGVVGQGGALLRCGVVQRERGSEADWLWPRADGLAGQVALTPRAVRRPPPLVRIFAIDLVQELVRAGRAQGSGAPSPRSRRAVGSLTTGVPESSSKKSGRRCRIGAVVFVAGVRPPARGGTKVKEPRS